MIRRTCLSVAGLIVAGSAKADWALNMPRGVTELSVQTYDLHMQVFYWCVAIGAVVFGAMIWSLIRHRKSLGAEPAKFSHSMAAEVIWTTIPIIILLLMAIPAAETLVKLEDGRKPDLTVVVTGYQWRWHYAYQGEDVSFYSSLARTSADARRKNSGIDPFTVENYLLEVDRPLVVPRGAKVRILLTSNDVLHAWWVPDLAIKKDAVPGFINETFFRAEESGVYRGQCAELCGMDHGYMPIVVEVLEQDEYQAWLDGQKSAEAKVATAK
ncbi:MAG: cytochrome c oxidase subunit II [Gammaproteobacteria bacterium]|nr:cytochrome c oxidase subunit II [Gammaproteobacteria bacterium]